MLTTPAGGRRWTPQQLQNLQPQNNFTTSQRGKFPNLRHFKLQPQLTWQLDNVVTWQRGNVATR